MLPSFCNKAMISSAQSGWGSSLEIVVWPVELVVAAMTCSRCSSSAPRKLGQLHGERPQARLSRKALTLYMRAALLVRSKLQALLQNPHAKNFFWLDETWRSSFFVHDELQDKKAKAIFRNLKSCQNGSHWSPLGFDCLPFWYKIVFEESTIVPFQDASWSTTTPVSAEP